ncbi:MAG: ribonuclease HI [Clostridium sp.]|uniref:ribonuclease HI n=1 Tax=Clostridium sp. TaxID=1506 RepID=UPI0025C272B3|nr:ribonuclease HI [Clostridium sp.]MCE5220182.1 ribonuclease HI [Clostridium sp.]
MDNIIYIFNDGGCRGNGKENNIGGWGCVLLYNGKIKEIYGSARNTTNNQMELTSCIEALKAIKNKSISVKVTMDSQYVVKGITEWIYNWIKKGWKTSTKKSVENKELWKELLELKNQFSDIKFLNCKGHSDNEGNNRADELVNIAMDEIES